MPEDQGMLDTLGNAVRLARSVFTTIPMLSPEGDSVLQSTKRLRIDGRNPLAGSLEDDRSNVGIGDCLAQHFHEIILNRLAMMILQPAIDG